MAIDPPAMAVPPPIARCTLLPAPPIAILSLSAVTAFACSASPNVAKAIALNLNNLLILPTTTDSEASVDDLTFPFANSDVTTNDWVVRFQITLKILFIKDKSPLYNKFNGIERTTCSKNNQAQNNGLLSTTTLRKSRVFRSDLYKSV